MSVEQIEERMQKFYKDKEDAAKKTYHNVLYEVTIPTVNKSNKDKPEMEEVVKEVVKENNIKLTRLDAEELDREFWRIYREEKEKQSL